MHTTIARLTDSLLTALHEILTLFGPEPYTASWGAREFMLYFGIAALYGYVIARIVRWAFHRTFSQHVFDHSFTAYLVAASSSLMLALTWPLTLSYAVGFVLGSAWYTLINTAIAIASSLAFITVVCVTLLRS